MGRLTAGGWVRLRFGVGAIAFLILGAQAGGQAPAAGGAAVVNPLLNPYASPFWSPAQAGSVDRSAALLWMLQTNNARGGLGSGQLSGVRPATNAGAAERPAAEMPYRASRPAGGASRYFLRGPQQQSLEGSVFRRHNRYFSNNGR